MTGWRFESSWAHSRKPRVCGAFGFWCPQAATYPSGQRLSRREAADFDGAPRSQFSAPAARADVRTGVSGALTVRSEAQRLERRLAARVLLVAEAVGADPTGLGEL